MPSDLKLTRSQILLSDKILDATLDARAPHLLDPFTELEEAACTRLLFLLSSQTEDVVVELEDGRKFTAAMDDGEAEKLNDRRVVIVGI